VQIDLETVKTNMVNISLSEDSPLNADEIAARLLEYGILVRPGGTYGFRFVTHYWITREHVDRVLEALRTILTTEAARSHSAAD
jgi:threonine aldolase